MSTPGQRPGSECRPPKKQPKRFRIAKMAAGNKHLRPRSGTATVIVEPYYRR